jgi:hypothetical protein
MRLISRRVIVPFLFLVGVAQTTVCAAQKFGQPEEERGRLAPMSQEVEKLSQLISKLKDVQDQKLRSLAPIENKPRTVVEKWRSEHEALSAYITMFRDLRGASAVLLNAVALSLHVSERYLLPFNLGNICMEMPGEGRQLIFLKERPSVARSVVQMYSFIGEGVLERNEMNIALEGLQSADRLAESYNALCNRVRNSENWKK